MENMLTTQAKRIGAIFAGAALLSASVAFADSVHNDLDASGDASLEVLDLVDGGAESTVQYSVTAADGDGVDGCNLAADSALTVSVTSGDPAVATVSPATLEFTNCTDVKEITVTPVGVGEAEITLSQTANASAGSFNLSGSAFAVVVAEAEVDTTPPVIEAEFSADANADGWHDGAVTVTWSVTDNESDILFTSIGCDGALFDEETAGTTFRCVAVSEGGAASATVTLMIDMTAPGVEILSPVDGAEFDLNAEVRADFSAEDDLSGVASVEGTVDDGEFIDTSVAGEHTFAVTATDNAGNTSVVEVSFVVHAEDDEDEDEDEDDEDEDDEDEDEDDDAEHGRRLGTTKVMVCHMGHTELHLASPAVSAHLAHGDTIGSCPDDDDADDLDDADDSDDGENTDDDDVSVQKEKKQKVMKKAANTVKKALKNVK